MIYSDWDRLEIGPVEKPRLNPGELLVRVAACGLCGSELEAFKKRSPRRRPPLVLGHEFCGEVVDIAQDGNTDWMGRKVVVNAVVSCGVCHQCLRGNSHLCIDRAVFGMNRPGAFAEYVAVPTSAVLAWPSTLAPQEACLAEPLANGVHIVRLCEPHAPKNVLVIGAGAIGLLCQQAFQSMLGAHVSVADVRPDRLQIAHELGAASIIDSGSSDVVERCRNLTGGAGMDVIVDAVGLSSTKRQSLQGTRAGGIAVWIGLAEDEISLATNDIILSERSVFGTYGAKMDDLEKALQLLASGSIQTKNWVQTFSLDVGVQAFHRMLAGKNNDIKAVIQPSL